MVASVESSKGPQIAEGRTAEVFTWGEDRVLKLFREGFPAKVVEHEADVTRQVHDAGLPAPAVHGVVEVDGRLGVVFDRIRGVSMLRELIARPWTVRRYAAMLAGLQARIHAASAPGLPSQRARLEGRIRSAGAHEPALREAVLAELAGLPEGLAVCHGDFHPDNVLISDRGPVVIDWPTATAGRAEGDVARTLLLLEVGEPLPGTPRRRLIEFLRHSYRRHYLDSYLRLRPTSREAIAAWRRPVAAARIDEGIPGELDRLLGIVRDRA